MEDGEGLGSMEVRKCETKEVEETHVEDKVGKRK
jgi:hypothetical protein